MTDDRIAYTPSRDPIQEDPGADLRSLYVEAVAATKDAIRHAEQAREEELRAMGARMQAEQDKLYSTVLANTQTAVREAAAKGHTYATVLSFGGSDKFGEFCYLYMLKGPYKAEQRDEMRAMGVKPLLHRLRAVLQRAGFGVHHAWQRATNENSISVSW